MAHRWLPVGVSLWLLLALTGVIGNYATAQEFCDGARKELQQEKQRLRDYVSALQESNDNRDSRLAEVLKVKIGQSKKKLQDLQLIIKDCPSRQSSVPAAGLHDAKSDDGRYADKSCIELKKMLFPLLVSKRALDRRQRSMLSRLTDEEEKELLEVTQQLQQMRKALRNRCSAGRRSHSLLKQLRRR